jgi:hypothetical protein
MPTAPRNGDRAAGSPWFAPGGVHLPPRDDEELVTPAQRLFLDAVAERVPAVLEGLAGVVWPYYRAAARRIRVNDNSPCIISVIDFEPACAPAFWIALRTWAYYCWLRDPWCERQALATLQEWESNGGPDLPTLANGWGAAEPPDDHDHQRRRHNLTRATHVIINPQWEHEDAAIARVRAAYRRARDLGAEPTPGNHAIYHLHWLALHQCAGLNAAQIGEWSNDYVPDSIDNTAVTRAVQRTAGLINLTLRPATLGAPTGPRRPKKRT